MSMWQQLKTSALLGTDKKPLAATGLAQPVQQQLDALDAAGTDAETYFLQATALATFYQQAGWLPAAYTGPAGQAATQETRPTAPAGLLEVLNNMETDDSLPLQYQLTLWLDVLLARGEIVKPSQVLPLTRLASAMDKPTRQKVGQVLGKKGLWALSFKKNNPFSLQLSDQQWHTDTNDQRRVLLAKMLQEDAAQAVAMLQSTWVQEGIATKKSFLALLNSHHSPAMLAFAEGLFLGEFSYKAKEKKTERECRQLVASLLLKLPESVLHQETTNYLAPYLQTQKSAFSLGLTSRSVSTFELPKKHDAFWNPELMLQFYGLDHETQPDWITYDMLYWLSFFLAHVHSPWWASLFKGNYEAMVNNFTATASYGSGSKRRTLLAIYEALVLNVQQFKDPQLAWHLIKADNKQQAALELTTYLDMPQYERYMVKQKLTLNADYLARSPAGYWSAGFCKDLAKEVATLMQGYYQNSWRYLGKAAARHFNPEAEATLDKYNERMAQGYDNKNWNKYFYNPIKSTLRIKRRLKAFG